MSNRLYLLTACAAVLAIVATHSEAQTMKPRRLVLKAGAGEALAPGAPNIEASEMKRIEPSISVTGVGKLSAVPDVADISVGVRTQAPTAEKALAENNQLMAKLQDRLKEHGVAAKDVQTTQFQVSPEYSQPPGHAPNGENEFVPRLIGYRVDNTVQVTAREISKLGELLDSLVQAGANQLYGISFRVNEPEKLMDEVRKRAMADAKRKADLVAGEAGVILGSPFIIELDGDGAPPAPRFFGAQPRMMAMMAAAPAAPIAAGEHELQVSVHVVYRLKEAK